MWPKLASFRRHAPGTDPSTDDRANDIGQPPPRHRRTGAVRFPLTALALLAVLAVMISVADEPRNFTASRVEQAPATSHASRNTSIAAGRALPDSAVSLGGTVKKPGRRRLICTGRIPRNIPVAEPVIVHTRGQGGGTHDITPGGVAGTGCNFDIECDDGDPCTVDWCDRPPGAPPGGGTCIHDTVPDGDPGECDDGLFCNGREVCNVSGNCETRDVPDCATAGQVCDDYQDACAEPCTTDAACDDGLHCNGTELCGLDNVCQPGTNPCGAGAICEEGVCTTTLLPCGRDADCPTGQTCSLRGPGCWAGRCCFTNVNPPSCTLHGDCPSGSCYAGRCLECVDSLRRTAAEGPSQDSRDQCLEKGSLWYPFDAGRPDPAGGETCAFPGHRCPQYSAGIAPHGDSLVTVGPVSRSPAPVDPPNGPGAPLFSLGDDYHLAGPDLLELAGFRWVGGADRLGKVQFELYDASGRLVDDFLAEVGPQIAVRPFLLDPPIIIPRDGFVVVRVLTYPEPNLRLYWLSTDEADVGTNDPDVLAVNDCQRDCDPTDCTSFLGPDPGILAFELVGRPVAPEAAPIGPCCNRMAQTCELKNEWECKSGLCVGGANDCRPCTKDDFCPDGYCDNGAYLGDFVSCNRCTADAPLNPLGPCSASDDCGGGDCVPRCDNAACCLPDGTCINDTTLDACTTQGGQSLGYGTDCDPDCCPRPVSAYTGADDCLDAIVQAVTIPAEGLCRDGDSRGQSCLSSADCASPGICIRSRSVTTTGDNSAASSTAENPDSCFGGPFDQRDDPGWWEAFHLDECATVLVDMCCTQPIHQPAYRIIFADCPCGPPIFAWPYYIWDPEGDYAWSQQGGPYCNEDNNWSWFGPLAPGTYYYPIYSSPHGHLGQYQLHIRAEACPVAACCTGSQCSLANVLNCEAGGGFFLGPPGKYPLEATCIPNSPDCDILSGTDCGTCQLGSCCAPLATGPGTCDDTLGLDLMTEEECDVAGGTFTGGVRCRGGTCSNNANRSCSWSDDCNFGAPCLGDPRQLAQPTPCPLCEIAGLYNCHESTTIEFEIDISEYTVGEVTIADDFVPTADTLTTLCTRGTYISTLPDSIDDEIGCRQRTGLPMGDPIDKFRVRIYEDGADDTDPTTPPDLPGALYAERFASSTGEAWGVVPPRVEGLSVRRPFFICNNPLCWEGFPIEEYQIDFGADPITGLQIDGRRYWIEIMNNMDESPLYEGEPSCIWFIRHSHEGNRYAAIGASGKFHGPKLIDLAFCLDFPFDDSTAPTGACCTCADGLCTDALTFEQCTILEGQWTPRGECTGPDAVTCVAQAPVNDTSEYAIDVTAFGDPLTGAVVIPTHHYCATTSLPDVQVCTDFSTPQYCNAPCEGPGSAGDIVAQDLWYKYVAPNDGILDIDMCATGTEWDSLFAVYKGPDGADDGTGNTCPVITDIESCNLAAFPDEDGAVASDEGCANAPIGGAGRTRREVVANTCYLIQAGAWGPTATTPGLGFLTIRQSPYRAAEITPCDNDFAAATNGAGGERLSRFGCITAPADPATAGGETTAAVQVFLQSMYNTTAGNPDTPVVCPSAGRTKPPLSQFEGQFRWLGAPQTADDEATPAPPDYIIASLVCTPEEAAVRDWSVTALAADFPTADPSRIFFYGREVVPCSVYDVRLCLDPLDELSCALVGAHVLTGKLGDCWPPFAPAPGQPTYADIGATVNKFKGLPFVPGATPTGAPPEWHALVRGNVVGNYDLSTVTKVNFIDIGNTVAGFKTIAYNEDGPCDPDTATDNCNRPCTTAP